MILAKDYHPNPGQAAFHASPSLVKYYCGALGAGKSSTLCVEGITLSIEHPGNVGLVARDTLPMLRTTTMQAFLDFLPEELVLQYIKNERKLVLRSSGDKPSIVYFGPLDEIGRYKSLDLGWIAVDEADSMTEEMFHILLGRLRVPKVRHSFMMASNPTTTHHWLYKKFFEGTDESYQLFRAKTRDNEKNLPQGYIERLEKSYPADLRKRYIEGEPGTVMSGTAVFPDFREDLHVRGCLHKPGRTLLRGWDFGYHFPCVVFAEFDELGRLLVLDSVHGKDEDLAPFAQRVITHTNLMYPQAKVEDFCDPAGIQKRDAGRPSITILNQDFRIYPRYRYSHVEERAACLRGLMRQVIYREPAFQIHPHVRNGIDSLIGYQYKKSKDGLSLDQPDKDNIHDHFIDALGYILVHTAMIKGENDLQSGYDSPNVEQPRFKSRLRGGGKWQKSGKVNLN